MTIVLREYTDNQGQAKKVYKTIGELVTWQGDDGSTYQSFECWGAGGIVQGKIFEQKEAEQNNQPRQQATQQQGGFQSQQQFNTPQGYSPQR